MKDSSSFSGQSSSLELQILQKYLLNLPGLVCWKDLEGVYLGCNDFMVNMLGYQSRADIIGKTDDIIWPEHAKKIKEHDLTVIQSGNAISHEETLKGRSFFSLKLPLRDQKQNIIGVICNANDITYLKGIEAELQEAKIQSENSDRAKSEFLAIVSHELRSPLTSILGMINLVTAKDNLSEQQKKMYLDNVSIAAKYLLSLVDDFLYFGKLDSGKFELTSISVDLKELIMETVSIFISQAHSKDLEIIIDYDEKIPHIILGDSRALRQIIINLLSNALKFTERGFITVKVECLEQTKETAKLALNIIDTGIGISEEKIGFIFDHFQQADASYGRRYPGVGLGLSITKKLVSIMDGSLYVMSKVNVGSTFQCVFDFPLQHKSIGYPWQSAEFTQFKDLFKEPESTQDKVPLESRKKVLLIDDEPIIQLIHREFLKELQCEVDSADNAKIALSILEKNSEYDIIFVDMGLPIISGVDFVKMVRKAENLKHLKVIALTGYSSQKDKDNFMDAGVDDVLIKPVTIEQLKKTLDKF